MSLSNCTPTFSNKFSTNDESEIENSIENQSLETRMNQIKELSEITRIIFDELDQTNSMINGPDSDLIKKIQPENLQLLNVKLMQALKKVIDINPDLGNLDLPLLNELNQKIGQSRKIDKTNPSELNEYNQNLFCIVSEVMKKTILNLETDLSLAHPCDQTIAAFTTIKQVLLAEIVEVNKMRSLIFADKQELITHKS